MRTPGTPAELERRRRLAVARLADGYSVEEVADFLGVSSRSVHRWAAAARGPGDGLAARPAPGRTPRLTPTEEKIALRWLTDRPTDHGFPTDLWTAARFGDLVRREFGAAFAPHYLCRWLRARGMSPQKPLRVPRERDPAAIAGWRATAWPRIKKTSAGGGPTWS